MLTQEAFQTCFSVIHLTQVWQNKYVPITINSGVYTCHGMAQDLFWLYANKHNKSIFMCLKSTCLATVIVWHCLNTWALQSCVDTDRTNDAALLTNQHVITPNSSNVAASVSGPNSNVDTLITPLASR